MIGEWVTVCLSVYMRPLVAPSLLNGEWITDGEWIIEPKCIHSSFWRNLLSSCSLVLILELLCIRKSYGKTHKVLIWSLEPGPEQTMELQEMSMRLKYYQ